MNRERHCIEKLPADYVVLSLGVRPVNTLEKQLAGASFPVISVGDAHRSGGTIADAVHSAFDACCQI